MQIKERFAGLWRRYFGEAELPLALWFSDETGGLETAPHVAGHHCLIGDLRKVRSGRPLCFDSEAVACSGGQRYLGFSQELRPGFEYFLSCGREGEIEGERYKKSPDLVTEFMKQTTPFVAPARYAVFKPWDALEPDDRPEVVIFFAPPDVLSGLFTLANFDEPGLEGVVAPFCAGCGAIVLHPWLEAQTDRPRCVLGMFDVSARPFVNGGELSFAAPIRKFERMVDNMEESFLITPSWEKVRKRLGADAGQD